MWAYLALASVKAVGGYQQADIIRQNATLQQSVTDMNAKFADLDAFQALKAGYGNAAKAQKGVDQAIGAGKAAYAGENVDVNYGTAGQRQSDNRVVGVQNYLQLKRNAENQAMGYKTQAINIRLGGEQQSLQAGLNASSAEASGLMGAASTVMGGLAFQASTGKGQTSRVGDDAPPAWGGKPTSSNMHVNDTGDGLMTPPPHEYANGYGWYPRGPGDNPGFFGTRESWASLSSGHSFTDEVG